MKRKFIMLLALCALPTIFGGQPDWELPMEGIVVIPDTPQSPGMPLKIMSTNPIFVENGTITVVGHGELPYSMVTEFLAETATPYIEGGGEVIFSAGGFTSEVQVEASQPPLGGAPAYFDQIKNAITALPPAITHVITTTQQTGDGYEPGSYEARFLYNMSTIAQEFAQEEADYLTDFFNNNPALFEPMMTVFANNGFAESLNELRDQLYDFSIHTPGDKIEVSCTATSTMIAIESASRKMLRLSSAGGPAIAAGAGLMLMSGYGLPAAAVFSAKAGLILATATAAAKTLEMIVPSVAELEIEMESTTLDTNVYYPFEVYMILGNQDNTYSDIVGWILNLGSGGGWIKDFYVKNGIKFSQKLTELGTDPSLPFTGNIARTGIDKEYQGCTINPGHMARVEDHTSSKCNERYILTHNEEGPFDLTVTVDIFWKTISKTISLNVKDMKWVELDKTAVISGPFRIEAGSGIFQEVVTGTHIARVTETTTEHNFEDVCSTFMPPDVQTLAGTIQARTEDMFDPLPPVIEGSGCLSGQLIGTATEYTIYYVATRDTETGDGDMSILPVTMKHIAIHEDSSECVWHSRISDPETFLVNWDMETKIAISPTHGFGFWRVDLTYCPYCTGGEFSHVPPPTTLEVNFDVDFCYTGPSL